QPFQADSRLAGAACVSLERLTYIGFQSGTGSPGSSRRQSLTVRSSLAEMRVLPSGVNASAQTTSLCPSSLAWTAPVAMFHYRTVASWLPVARDFPSGEKATDSTRPQWPLSEAYSSPSAALHR